MLEKYYYIVLALLLAPANQPNKLGSPVVCRRRRPLACCWLASESQKGKARDMECKRDGTR